MKAITDLTEIKLILLYVINNLEEPIQIKNITDVIMQHSLVNYFTLLQYLSDLTLNDYVTKNITEGKETYKLSQKGKQVLSFFEKKLPFSVRKLLLPGTGSASHKNSSFISADYYPTNKNEFMAECKIVENNSPLFEIKLAVGSMKQAQRICAFFTEKYEEIYDDIIGKLNSD